MLNVDYPLVNKLADDLANKASVRDRFSDYFNNGPENAASCKLRFIKWIRQTYGCNLTEAKYTAEETYSLIYDKEKPSQPESIYDRVVLYPAASTPHDLEMLARDYVEIYVIDGVDGNSLSINDYRVAGSKPWGGGRIVHTFNVKKTDLYRALCLEEVDE